MTYKIVLSVVFFLGAASAHAAPPALPRVYVDSTMPTTSVTKTVCASGCDYTNAQLQTAIDDAVLGTKILLQPGISYTPPSTQGFFLRNKTSGSGWIIIQTKTTLPAEGTRATPTDATNYAKLLKSSLYALSCDDTAHHYRLIGVEFMNPGNVDVGSGGTAFVNCDGQETTLATQAHHILFDRIYMHGPPAAQSFGVKFGLVLNGQYQGVIDSTIVDLTYDTDAIAVVGGGGAGTFLIRNNALSSSGENIMFGGSDPTVPDLSPSDITIMHNYIYKPLKWRDDSAYNTTSNKILVKNLLELKHAKRTLIDGNTFENMWPSAQVGFALTITPRQGGPSNRAPQTTVQDLTITNNLIKNTANGIALSGYDAGTEPGTSPTTQAPGGRFLIKNNLFIGQGGYAGTGIVFQIGNQPFDVTIQHNTVASSAPFGTTTGTTIMFAEAYNVRPLKNFVLKDNIFLARNYPYFASGCSLSVLATKAPGYVWTNTVFAGPWPTPVGCTLSVAMPQGNGNAYPASESLIQYVNQAGGVYSLTVGSPYRDAASDGTDIGVNWAELMAAQQGISTGVTDLAPPSAPLGLLVR